jgi:hypothetical protein
VTRPATGSARRAGVAVTILVVTLALVACIPPRPSASAMPTPDATAQPTSSGATAASPAPAESPSDGAGIVVDPTLLEHLPPDIAGIPRTPDPETAADIAGEPLLDAYVSGLSVAIYPSDPDYAVATVARLHPEVFDETWFRGWRDTFDEGVCSQAGGVAPGHSEVDLGGRHVFRSGCNGGVVIYHAWLPDSNAIVSIQGAGPLDMGRSVVSGLTE